MTIWRARVVDFHSQIASDNNLSPVFFTNGAIAFDEGIKHERD